jgi:hypothetical protein
VLFRFRDMMLFRAAAREPSHEAWRQPSMQRSADAEWDESPAGRGLGWHAAEFLEHAHRRLRHADLSDYEWRGNSVKALSCRHVAGLHGPAQ